MRWGVEYYEQTDTAQPAEEFEVSLKRQHKKLGAKLRAIAAAIEVYGPQLGGGLIEPCHDYKGLWEMVQPQTVVDNSSPFLLLVWLPFSI